MKLTRLSAAILCCCLLFSAFLPFHSVLANEVDVESEETEKKRERIEQLERFYEIFAYLQEYHVDNPSAEQLMEDAIFGMLFFMDDPYTTYMSAEEYEEFLQSVNGAFVGIGVVVEQVDGGALIHELLPGGPAEKTGLQVGDIIIAVDGEPIEGHNVEEATNNILGEEGTEVEITIQRTGNNEEEVLTYQLIRGRVTLPHVELVMLDRDTAQLKLYRFGTNTYDIMRAELKRMDLLNVENVILDLRGNSGGMMDSVMDIASLFKESGDVFHTKDNTGNIKSYEISAGSEWDKPLVVLVDYSTASAAEVLAGFLQDYELAAIVGEGTFGKGKIQTSIELEHGGVLHLSIEEYFTPKMNKVDNEGIHPDIYIAEPDLQLAKAYGFLKNRDDIELYDDGRVAFSGLRKEFKQYAFYQEDTWYLSARMLSDWFGGRIEWDWDTQRIYLELFDRIYVLGQDHPQLLLLDGKGYLSLDFIVEELPLQLIEENDRIVVQKNHAEDR